MAKPQSHDGARTYSKGSCLKWEGELWRVGEGGKSRGHLKWFWQLLQELGTPIAGDRRALLLKSWPTVLAPFVWTCSGHDLALHSASHFTRLTAFMSMAT